MIRPNILWICSDQQRFDTLGCYGNPFVKTPNIDRLARGGVLFERAYSQSPVCTPSRAAFLTGRYPRTARARQNGADIPADEVLVTKILNDAGYIGGLSGKLHLSTCDPEVQKGTERRIDDGYDEFHWSHHPKPDWPTSDYFHWLQERGVKYETPAHPESEHIQIGMPSEHHQTTWCAEKAITFIETNADFDSPWFFSVNFFDPHHAFDPPAEYLAPYLDRLDDIPLPNYAPGELDNKPIFQQIDHKGAYNSAQYRDPGNFAWDHMTEKDHKLVRAAYWAMIDQIDMQVGRMMDALERTGQLENTLVIFTSDHGELLGDHGIYLKGPHFYEPSIRVPLILSWPGRIGEGQRSAALVELVDLPQTILDAAGMEHHKGMQGRSLWPLLTGEAGAHRDDVYCEYYNAINSHKDPKAQCTMVRTDRYKLVRYHNTDSGELYDLQEDPTETANLWNSAAHTSVKLDMLLRLSDRMAWTVDPLPERQGRY